MNEVKHKIDNTYIHYVKFGEGPKNVVFVSGVSLCGFEGMGAAIAKQYRLMTEDYTCYVFDRRADITESCTTSNFSDDLYYTLKEIGIDKADFVGYSQGGMISLDMALRHSDIVNKLVLCSTTAEANEISGEVWKQCRDYLNKGDVHSFNMYLYKRIYSDAFFKANEAALDRLAKNGSKAQVIRFIHLTESMDAFNVRNELKNITCPCFVIGSLNDQIFGVQASIDLAKALGCESYIYQDQAHASCDEAPDFCERVLAFLRKN